jgi:hypothetical protein
MTRRTLQLAAVWLASMAACDGSELLSGSGTIPRGQLLEQFAAIICDHLAPCCQADGLAYDSASCRQTAEVGFAAQYTFVSSSYASYDGQAARRCLSAFAAAMPACGAKDVGWGDLPLDETEYAFPASVIAACKGVFTGTAPAGTACTSSKECAMPTQGVGYCDFYAGSCLVYTTPYPHAAAGAPCFSSCATPDGSSCYGSAPTASYLTLAECYSSDGLACAPAPGGPKGDYVCLPPGAIGQSCASGCVAGAVCNAAALCVAISELGGPCETDTQCVEGTLCDAGVCASPSDSGPCISPRDCSSAAYCDFGTLSCMPKRPDGATCTQGDSCLDRCGSLTSNSTWIGPPSICEKGSPSATACMGVLN